MYDEEMAWNEFRAKCNQEAQDRNDNIIKSWLHKIGYKSTVGYYFNFTYHIVEIYTRHPGQLIGKEGRNIDDLEKMASDRYGGEWEVRFTEVRGGFVDGQQAD